MKILFADKFPQAWFEHLQQQGHECSLQPDLGADDLAGAIGDHEALVVRSTRVNDAAIKAGSALKLVIRAGAGTNTIDKPCAREHGVAVCNVPGKNALAVAELAMGLLLAIDRNIPDNVIALRSGQWNKKKFSVAKGLYGRKLGIIGMGAIGLALARRARAFGIEVYALAKPGRSAQTLEQFEALGILQLDGMDALLETCDILSFHVPANEQTKAMVNAQLLAKMQPGAILLNTARGELIDEAALIQAMDEKGIRAGLDVYANEPAGAEGGFDSALARHPNVYGAHHIGASTSQAQDAVAQGVIEVIDAWLQGETLNCVN